MRGLDEIINQSRDTREMKRALSVKMVLTGLSPGTISELLDVSVQYVSKWKVNYEVGGAAVLRVRYRGREGYLTSAEQAEVSGWIKAHETLSVAALRDYVEETYGVVYQSKQSYYDLLQVGGLSYHWSEKVNPRRGEAQVLAKREEIKKVGALP